MRRTVFGAAAAALLVGLAGCGESGPKIVPVSGIVLIDGQPLTYGHIQVLPNGWRPASGRIDGAGRFTLTTTVNGDGCAVGSHPVVILAGESLTPENTKWHAPKKYADVTTTDLTVEITGPTDNLKITLTWGGNKGGTEKPGTEGGTENQGFNFGK